MTNRHLRTYTRRLIILTLVACAEPERALEPVEVAEEVSPATAPAQGVIPAGGDGWATVTVGAAHSCALTVSGELFCWGENRFAQIGVADAPEVCGPPAAPCARTPLRMSTTLRFSSISAGGAHTCALTADGAAYCWGSNSFGQLGTTSPRVASDPIAVPGGHRYRQIAAGENHSCGLRIDGVVLCWGRNENGELGRGQGGASAIPVVARPAPPFEQLASGAGRTCASTAQSAVYCWGRIWLYTQGGLEWSRRQTTPQAVPGDTRLATLSVGTLSTCGVSPASEAHCWEANGFGQLGTGSMSGSELPAPVAGSLAFRTVSTGSIQTCGIAEDLRGWCWGNNTFGQLGNHDVTSVCAPASLPCASRPTAVRGRLRFIALATGLGNHTCGVTTLTNLYCWGLGTNGQLGEGDPRTVIRYEATRVRAR